MLKSKIINLANFGIIFLVLFLFSFSFSTKVRAYSWDWACIDRVGSNASAICSQCFSPDRLGNHDICSPVGTQSSCRGGIIYERQCVANPWDNTWGCWNGDAYSTGRSCATSDCCQDVPNNVKITGTHSLDEAITCNTTNTADCLDLTQVPSSCSAADIVLEAYGCQVASGQSDCTGIGTCQGTRLAQYNANQTRRICLSSFFNQARQSGLCHLQIDIRKNQSGCPAGNLIAIVKNCGPAQQRVTPTPTPPPTSTPTRTPTPTSTPTRTPTPTPALICHSLNSLFSGPVNEGQTVYFRCQAANKEPNHFNFRYRRNNQEWNYFAMGVPSQAMAAEASFVVPSPGGWGHYVVQCQVCDSADNSICTEWGKANLIRPTPTPR